MIYHLVGYFSTTARLKDKATPLQTALAGVPSMETLQILEKLTYNCVVMPKEIKYRRIKLSNPKIKAAVANVPAALQALQLMGWGAVPNDADGDILVLPEMQSVTMAQVRDIQDAQREVTKRERELQRQAISAAAGLPGNKEQVAAKIEMQKDNEQLVENA